MSLRYGETNVPIVLNDCIAYLECKVVQTFDVDTHLIFIGELLASDIINDTLEPMTYSYYRKVKKGFSSENAPTYIAQSKVKEAATTGNADKYNCFICDYIYDESVEHIKFADLPDDWVCPICGAGKEDFSKI